MVIVVGYAAYFYKLWPLLNNLLMYLKIAADTLYFVILMIILIYHCDCYKKINKYVLEDKETK